MVSGVNTLAVRLAAVKGCTATLSEAQLIPACQPPIRPLWRQDNVERQTVSIMKACEMVGVSRRTIYNWIAASKVEYLRTAGGSIRIFVDSLWREPDGSTRPSSPNAAA